MSNAHVTFQLTDYIDGTLSPYWTEKVKSHLIFCNACRQDLAELEENIRKLRSAPVPPPAAGLEDRIVGRLKEELRTIDEAPARIKSPGRPFWMSLPKIVALVAACAVVGLALFSLPPYSRRHSEPHDGASLDRKAIPPEPGPNSEFRAGSIAAKPPPGFAGNESARTLDSSASNPAASARRQAYEVPMNLTLDSFKKAEESRLKAALRSETAQRPPKPKDNATGDNPELVAGASPGEPIFQELTGVSSAIATTIESVISDEAAWAKLWEAHTRDQSPKPQRPKVDFKTSQVIAIFAGTRPSAGYSVRIDEVENTVWDGRPARVVRYSVRNPAPGAITASVMSQPFVFKVLPRFSGRTFIQQGL